MRLTRLHAPTLKEAPKEAELVSHQLMIRAGYIRKLAAGVYDYLPLGVRTLLKVQTIIRQELGRHGAQEVLLPAVQPAELWQESGRWQRYGPELLRFRDRKGADFCFGPTHEEVITDLVRRDVRSYRDLPLNLFQIQVKFRDEMRPRGGLMRGREFLMKDGYSFDVDEAAAKVSYRNMYDAYNRICRRCGFSFRVCEADTGAIGGSLSHEFQVLADSGEDAMLACSACDYAANLEKAEVAAPPAASSSAPPSVGRPVAVATPDQRTVDEVTTFLGIAPSELIKTLLYRADNRIVAFLVRGDHELSETKAKAFIKAGEFEMADPDAVVATTGAPVGFAGPVGLPRDVLVYADAALRAGVEYVTGGNAADTHLRGVVLGRDFGATTVGDLRTASLDDPCPRCGAPVRLYRGIEIGHIFYLGTKYSAPMHTTYLDAEGQERPVVMGCYGIGVSRILAAAVEQNHDENGICWPTPMAPFQVSLLPLNVKDEALMRAAETLYEQLTSLGIEVLMDDRDERPGVKFKDADLQGMPFQLVLGRKTLDAGTVELRRRDDHKPVLVPLASAASDVAGRVRSDIARFGGEL